VLNANGATCLHGQLGALLPRLQTFTRRHTGLAGSVPKLINHDILLRAGRRWKEREREREKRGGGREEGEESEERVKEERGREGEG
jgi:hypothetical protein